MAALKAATSRSPTTSAVVTAIGAVLPVTRWQGNELLPWGTTTLQLPTVRSDVTLSPGAAPISLVRPVGATAAALILRPARGMDTA